MSIKFHETLLINLYYIRAEGDHAKISSREELKITAKLLEISENSLEQAFTLRKMEVNSQKIQIKMTSAQAADIRDTLASVNLILIFNIIFQNLFL